MCTADWILSDLCGYVLSAGSRYEVADGDLTITLIRVADMGNYTCMASNLVGMASAVVEVLVRGELGGDKINNETCKNCFMWN